MRSAIMITMERKFAPMLMVLVLMRAVQIMVGQETEKSFILVRLCMFNKMLEQPRKLYQLVQFRNGTYVGPKHKNGDPAKHRVRR